MKRALLLAVLSASACSDRTQIALQYQLSGIDFSTVVRVETYISVDPSDSRNFFADQPYRSVAQGVGYEVRDFDGTGKRKVLVTHDATLGFVFAPSFTFTLLPPSGEAAPPLIVTARAVGASTMLGRTDELKTRFAVGAKLKVPLSDMRCNGIACATDEQCCNLSCTKTETDATSCGGCGMACAPGGDSCAGGTCQCAGGSACVAPQTCCGGIGCIDLNTDKFNCGVCGHACNPGETCQLGGCVCNGGGACAAGGLCCAATGCSSTGSCPCGASACNSPKVCCDNVAGTCVNLKNDNANCGGCGVSCAAGLQCQNGACACNGQICSHGDMCCANGCANLQSSTANCGSCGHSCANNERCKDGTCKCGDTTCSTGQSCCGMSCKDLMIDTMNCGGCGHTCNAGEQCAAGHCVCPGTAPPRACTASETCCPAAGNVGAGGCFDLATTHDHCGQCAHGCAVTEQCLTGVCKPTLCSPPCANGNVCNTVTLMCECNSGPACANQLYCCASGCADRLSDPANCGACSNDVRPNLCCNGNSTPNNESNCGQCGMACGGSQFCCGNLAGPPFNCVDNDIKNCGGCGIICNTFGDGGATSARMCCACGRMGFCSQVCPAVACDPGPGT